MFHNYLISALRNFTRHKLYGFINIAGLTVGLTCAIFIILFARDELSYDKWIPGTEHLYRVEGTTNLPGATPRYWTRVSFPVTQAMLEQIPEVTARTRLIRPLVSILMGEKEFPERIDVVDPNFLQVIRLPLISGVAATALTGANSVILSQTRARKYFGDKPALGKTLIMSARYCDEFDQDCEIKRQVLTVTGVLRDLPHNTQLAADLMMPDTSNAAPITNELRTNWQWTSGFGYVKLAPGADVGNVTAKLRALLDRSLADSNRQANIPLRGSQLFTPHLTPFRDDHLSTDKYGSMTAPGSWTVVYGFIAIGVLILLVACFNFTNLATARAMIRAREISLRKVVGATRLQVTVQFLGESILIALIALALALALSEMLLPAFDRFLNVPIAFHYLKDWPVLLFIVGIGLLTGLLSGIYPALVLSGVRPAMALRVSSSNGQGAGLTRTALVVLQFAVSIGLGVAALVIFAQISFARTIDLGFQKDGVVLLNAVDLPATTAKALVRALRTDPDIADAALSDLVPLSPEDHANTMVRLPGNPIGQGFSYVPAGPGYMQVYGIRLVAGRVLSEQHGGDAVTTEQQMGEGPPGNVMINEEAARRLGFSPQQALGKTLTLTNNAIVTVVGVVADVKHDGPKYPVAATIFRYQSDHPGGWISVRLDKGRTREGLAAVDHIWRAFAPSVALQRHFLDDDYNKQFLTDERQGTIFDVFVGIAIFIAAMGLFGLAAFSTERRTREIGIRKTFGAKTKDIVLMLLWQFSIPVLIANVIAWPVAYYYLNGWLEGYAYRISLSPLYFVGAGAVALVIAWATVIVHAAHVARANPIHALRYE